MVEPDAEADHALPVLGQPDLLHLVKAGCELVGHRLRLGSVVLGRGALEGRLDQRPTLQGQELVVGLTEGDLADVLDAVAGHLGALELEHHPVVARMTGGADGGKLRRRPVRGLGASRACFRRCGPRRRTARCRGRSRRRGRRRGSPGPGCRRRTARSSEPDPPQAARVSIVRTSRPGTSRADRRAITQSDHAHGALRDSRVPHHTERPGVERACWLRRWSRGHRRPPSLMRVDAGVSCYPRSSTGSRLTLLFYSRACPFAACATRRRRDRYLRDNGGRDNQHDCWNRQVVQRQQGLWLHPARVRQRRVRPRQRHPGRCFAPGRPGRRVRHHRGPKGPQATNVRAVAAQ